MARRQRFSPGVDRKVTVRKLWGRWWWFCHLCQPPQHGSTVSYETTLHNVARHCRHQRQHHDYVRRNTR